MESYHKGGYAGAFISMESVSRITFTVEGAQSVNTALLAASIHHHTFIDMVKLSQVIFFSIKILHLP